MADRFEMGGREENREHPPLNKIEAQLCQKEYEQHMRETNAFSGDGIGSVLVT